MEPTLRPIREGDEERFRTLAGEKHVLRFLPEMEMTPRYAEKLAEESRLYAVFSPCDQMRLFGIYQGEELAGALTLGPVYEAGYQVTLGFFLGSGYLGKGLASGAVRKALEIAREAGAPAVFALTDAENARSVRLLEKVGFREEKRSDLRLYGKREKTETILWKYTW